MCAPEKGAGAYFRETPGHGGVGVCLRTSSKPSSDFLGFGPPCCWLSIRSGSGLGFAVPFKLVRVWGRVKAAGHGSASQTLS